MIPQINVISLVNTVAVLSDDTFNGNFHMVDNSRGALTYGQGTDSLCTQVVAYQVLNWHVWAINVQMDVVVSGIRWYRDGALITSPDEEPCAKSKFYGAPSGSYWAAVITTAAKGRYQYQLKIKMQGKEEWMSSFPAIEVV